MSTPCEQTEAIKEIRTDMKDIKKLLNGNGEIGVVEKARRAYEYAEKAEVSKNGLLDWAFRAVVGILLAYIAARIGLS